MGYIELTRTPDDVLALPWDDWRNLLRQAAQHGWNAMRTAAVGPNDPPAELSEMQAHALANRLDRMTGEDLPRGVAEFCRRGAFRIAFERW